MPCSKITSTKFLCLIFSLQTKKYKFLRPKHPVRDNATAWWKFAISSIMREIRQKNTKRNQFILPDEFVERCKPQFQKLFAKRFQHEIDKVEAIAESREP